MNLAEIELWWNNLLDSWPNDYEEEQKEFKRVKALGVAGYVEEAYDGWSDDAVKRDDPEFYEVRELLRRIKAVSDKSETE